MVKVRATKVLIGASLAASAAAGASAATPSAPAYLARDDVQWTTLGASENDSMPIGNGDLAANVWTEANGDLVLLIAKSDAWSELGKTDKLARIRVHLSDNPFTGKGFTQTLHLEDASIEIRQGANRMTVWADADRPVIHVTGNFAKPTRIAAKLELWRNRTHSFNQPSPDRGGMFGLQGFGPNPPKLPVDFAADTVAPAGRDQLTWYHRNPDSIYPVVLKQQHLEQLQGKFPDPLLGRIFGATLVSPQLVSAGDRTLQSAAPQKTLRLDLVALTTTAPDTASVWTDKITRLSRAIADVPIATAWRQHQAWWASFWNRSWVQVGGSADARAVEQGYVMQRYMLATSSRGAYPVHFNGGLFTVGGDMPDNIDSTPERHNPDFRQWGSAYWNQNVRQLYWPLLASGDFDLMKPWYAMYVNALPLVKARTRLYYHHDGAALIETSNFWGLPTLNDFGWDNKTNEVSSPFMRYHTQGNLEVLAQMIDQYAMTQDEQFARETMLPFADAVLTYYAEHWPKRDASGKIVFFPDAAIETYQLDATNPMPDLAGLYWATEHLLKLPAGLTSASERAAWQKLQSALPPLPKGTTHDGKIPPHAKGDPDGTPVLLPAQSYGDTKNIENPELYAVFPYRLYGVGKPDLKLARDTFAARLFPLDYCWGQDGEHAALLGLTDDARKVVVKEFTNYSPQRFKWFWDKAKDWVPDLDNGGAGMATLQYMLLQSDGRKIRLTPAWPKDWTADFKLHAPDRTIVQGHVENGRVTQLKTFPAARQKDVEIIASR